MPFYDYVCRDCGSEHEENHSMTASPVIGCRKCGSKNTFKAVRACGIIARSTGTQRRFEDARKTQTEQRQDLRENYGVENVTPVLGNSLASVYNDVKSQGSLVKDEMQAKRESNAAAVKAKQRAWTEKAHKRVGARTKFVNKLKAEAKQKKNAISL